MKEDVKDGFRKFIHSTPTSRSSTPGLRTRQAALADGEPYNCNEAAKPTTEATTLQVQIHIASPSPNRPQSTLPTLLGATSQLEHIRSTTPTISSSEGQAIPTVGESTSTIVPDLAHPDSVPIPEEPMQSGESQASVVAAETTQTDETFVENLQGPQSPASPDTQPPSSSEPIDKPSDAPTAKQEDKEKASSHWYTGVKATLAFVEKVSDVFPPLKSAVAAVNGILDTYDVNCFFVPSNKQIIDSNTHRPSKTTNETLSALLRG
jgi:hypothetical protein